MRFIGFLLHSAVASCAYAASHSVRLEQISLENLNSWSLRASRNQNFPIRMNSGGWKQQPVLQPHDDYAIPIYNLFNARYYVNIVIGTGSQTYKVIVDTSSGHLLISTDDVGGASTALLERYDNKPFPRRDTVRIGDLVIDNQDYAEIPDVELEDVDGILGLAYIADDSRSPWSNIIDQGLIDDALFAIHLGDSEKDQESALTFGGINEDHYTGKITYLPTSRKGYWELKLDSVTLDSDIISLDNTAAAIDTGTVFLILPSSLATLLNKQIGAQRDGTIDCGKRQSEPKLKFSLAGHEFAIAAQDYILESKSGDCSSAIRGYDLQSPSGPLAVLGDAFLRRWYSVYNSENGTIGLAESV